tara:strand:+ start:1000 stop:1314 length:315 start_codon:yes stop_codon:yes gene_type:complete
MKTINPTAHSSIEKGSQAGRAGDFNLIGPAVGAESIDVSNGDYVIESPLGAKALWVGVAGDVSLVMIDGTDVVFEGVPAGTLLPIQFMLVYQEATTAESLVALT